MDERELEPFYVVGYYHLESYSTQDITYHYFTTTVTRSELIDGIQRKLEIHHRGRVIILWTQEFEECSRDTSYSRQYAGFDTVANKLVENEMLRRAMNLNKRQVRAVEQIIKDEDGDINDFYTKLNAAVTNIVKTHVTDELIYNVSKDIEGIWNQGAVPLLKSINNTSKAS